VHAKRRGRPWRKWEHGVFCRSAARDHPLIGLKARLLAQKGLLQSLVVAAVWGFTKARQNGLDHAGSHRRANGNSESLSGLSTYVIVMIIMKRYQAFFNHSQSTSPLYTKYQQLLSLRMVATLPNIPLGETTLFVENSAYNRELLVFATTFYLLVRNRKTRRGIRAFFLPKFHPERS
jgi:hypothetical protein